MSAVAAASMFVACGVGFAALRSHPPVRRRVVAPAARATPPRAVRVIPLVILAVAATALGALVPIAAIGLGYWSWRRWGKLRRQRQLDMVCRQRWPEFVELLAVMVASGLPPRSALAETIEAAPCELQPMLAEVGVRLERGERFADAVRLLRSQVGLDAAAVVDVLLAAHRDGLAAGSVLDRLAGQARSQRRHDAAAAARRLPVRLAAPLVLCTLPGFVLLAIVPLVAGALSSLSLT